MDRQQLMDAYQQACEIELQAFKPGNVSVFSEGHDMTVAQFRLSAQVSALPLTDPGYTVGEKIYYAVKATREAVGCNTNLGIILLCAPVMQAIQQRASKQTLREALDCVLANTTEQDAHWAFKAIALAAPGGLGVAEQADVNAPAAVTLTQAMIIAAERDRIAGQYANGFKELFDFAVLQYNRAFVWFGDSSWAALTVFAEMLAQYPDSHVERKYGKQYSEWIAGEMTLLCKALKTAKQPEQLLSRLYEMDEAFKAQKINPGTSADLTVATVFVVLLEQLISGDWQV